MTKGIIVLDGPDACGKTTLADEIKTVCNRLEIPFQYQHAEYRFKERIFQYHEAILRKAIRFSQTGIAVIDRLHWSEYVYSRVYRSGSKWPLQWRYFERLLQKHSALQVICCGKNPAEVVEWHAKAQKERPEMYDTGLDSVAEEYIKIYNRNHTRTDYYHYYRDSYPDYYTRQLFAELLLSDLEVLRARQFPTALEANSYNLLGYVPAAKFVFLGERLNNKGRHEIWPFWEYANSSLYLTKVLDEIGFNERDAVWTNYYSDEDQFYLHDILEYNSNLKVIAFGNDQYKQLVKQSIDAINVYHPSYAKRFSVNGYADILRENLKYA